MDLRKRFIAFFCSSLLLLFLSGKPAFAAGASFVQAQTSATGSRVTSQTVTFQNVKAGDLLIGWFGQYDSAGQVSVSDNFNGAWTRVTGETYSSGGGDLALYYKLNSKAAVNMTITATVSSATYIQIGVSEYSGIQTNATIDKTAVAELPSSANSINVTAGPTASVSAGQIIFGAEITGGNPTSVSVGSSQGVNFVKRSSTGSGSVAVEDILNSGSGTQSASFTLGTSTDWYSVVATINNPTPGAPTPTPTLPATIDGPQTSLHYTPNGNFDIQGNYLPVNYGFNLTDAESIADVTNTPSTSKALIFLGLCNGADANFISTVTPYIGNSKVYGYYVMDDPDPTGLYATQCTAAHLKAESDWIHQNDPGKKTFIVPMNLGSSATPDFTGSYNPTNSDIDLYGVDMFPCRTNLNGCDNTTVTRAVAAAEAIGIPQSAIIPMYQTFGGGGFTVDTGGDYQMPTTTQVLENLSTWKSLAPSPQFDYTYSWGDQQGDTALTDSASLKALFALFNAPSSTSNVPALTIDAYGSSFNSNSANPNMISGWEKVIMAGPHFVGLSQFISGANADDAQNVVVYVSPTAAHDDLFITIKKAALTNLASLKPNIPFPWQQGYNTVSDIYSISAVASFNGYPDNQLDGPATIILPYTKSLPKSKIFLLEYDSNHRKWVPLKNSIVTAENRTVAATTNYFSYFAVGYRK